MRAKTRSSPTENREHFCLQPPLDAPSTFDKNIFPDILDKCKDGTWRSLVARFLGVEEAVSSNLAVPITKGFQLWLS